MVVTVAILGAVLIAFEMLWIRAEFKLRKKQKELESWTTVGIGEE